MPHGNRVRLKCLASISDFYWKSAEITLLQEKPKFASVMTNGETAGHLSDGGDNSDFDVTDGDSSSNSDGKNQKVSSM